MCYFVPLPLLVLMLFSMLAIEFSDVFAHLFQMHRPFEVPAGGTGRDVPCRAVGVSVPCQIFSCRALMIRAVPNISVPCRARILVSGSWYQDLGTNILVPRSWYQKKNGEPERRSLSVCREARGAAGPPPGGLGGWKPPRKRKNNKKSVKK